MYNTDFTTIFSEQEIQFTGHKLLEFGQTKDGFGLFVKATDTITAGPVYILPNGTITSVSTNGSLKGYLETDLAGTESEPQYIFVRTFGKNSAGDFVVPEKISGQAS